MQDNGNWGGPSATLFREGIRKDDWYMVGGGDGFFVVPDLGSPNIVTTDEKRREVWIYDKVSTDRVDQEHSVGGTIIILGGHTGSGSSSTTQKTLTIIIKYDEAKKVRDFAYNYSQF